MSSNPNSFRSKPCAQFQHNACTHGDACPFAHVKCPGVCYKFLHGKCTDDACKFSHDYSRFMPTPTSVTHSLPHITPVAAQAQNNARPKTFELFPAGAPTSKPLYAGAPNPPPSTAVPKVHNRGPPSNSAAGQPRPPDDYRQKQQLSVPPNPKAPHPPPVKSKTKRREHLSKHPKIDAVGAAATKDLSYTRCKSELPSINLTIVKLSVGIPGKTIQTFFETNATKTTAHFLKNILN